MLFYNSIEDYIQGQQARLANLLNANLPERGIVLKVLLPGENQDKSGNVVNYSITHEVQQIEVDYLGIIGDRHRRAHKPSGGRETTLYPKKTQMKEHRHLFAVSPYDCRVLSDKLGVEVTPELLGANLVIGREDGRDYSLSSLPHQAYLIIAPEQSLEMSNPPIATLLNYAKQQGCGVTGNALAKIYNDKTLTKRFIEHSKDNRGIVCSIEYPVEPTAAIRQGQRVFCKFTMGIAP